MPITLDVCENGRVLAYTFREPFELNEINALYVKDIAHRESVDFMVHTFFDVQGVIHLPNGVLKTRLGSPVFDHPRAGVIVMVGAVSLTKAVAAVMLRLARKKAFFFDNIDAGWKYMREVINGKAPMVASSDNVTSEISASSNPQ